jgi:drug/metabolite transporter (DMT)-like permease
VTVLIAGGPVTTGGVAGGAGAGGGTAWQPASSAAAMMALAADAVFTCVALVVTRVASGSGVLARLECGRMWVVYLNMLLVLALAIFIVWWTMGGKLRRGKRKPGDVPSSARRHDDSSGDH